MEQFGYSSNPHIVSHNEAFRYRYYQTKFYTNMLMIERFKDQVTREHLLSVTVYPVNTFSNNNPTFTSMGSQNTNIILSCKDETARIPGT